jgi:hypothetical protein
MPQRKLSELARLCIIEEFQRRPWPSLMALTRAVRARCAELGLDDRPSRSMVDFVLRAMPRRAVVRRTAPGFEEAPTLERMGA